MENQDNDSQNSILDRVLTSKQAQERIQFNPQEIVFNLFKNLSQKEIEVLKRRFSLVSGSQKETLEKIGKLLGVTRERIRQIENEGIKKINQLKPNHPDKVVLDNLENMIRGLLEEYGGVMSEEHLLEELLSFSGKSNGHKQALKFIQRELLMDKFDMIKSDSDFLRGWKTKFASLEFVKKTLEELKTIIKSYKKLLSVEKIMNFLEKTEFYKEHPEKLTREAVDAYLRISKKIKPNIFGEWGLSFWSQVTPKRMNDKVYLILKKEGEPLHFTKITKLINEVKFDHKVAYPATIHNELILDKKKYVLVGRGIYALREWGYERGTVAEVIENILKISRESLTKEEIVKEVLKKRIVRQTTIYLALMNEQKFTKLSDGRYELKEKDESKENFETKEKIKAKTSI